MSLLKKIRNGLKGKLIVLGLAASMACPMAAKLKADEKPVHFKAGAGFGYRTLNVGDELEDYVDLTRQNFDPAMPGFKDFMQLGKQLPYLSLELAVKPTRWHLFSDDSLEFFVSGDFSSSAIFGSTTDQETYDASVQAIKLGATPSVWTQELDFYQASGLGARYSPASFGLGNNLRFKPAISGKGGFSYLDSNSILHIHVNDDHPENTTEGITWELLNQFDVYQDIRTDADCYGKGYFAEANLGFGLEWKSWNFGISGGYRYEKIPEFNIHERTVSDGNLETKKSDLEYDAGGWDFQVMVNREF